MSCTPSNFIFTCTRLRINLPFFFFSPEKGGVLTNRVYLLEILPYINCSLLYICVASNCAPPSKKKVLSSAYATGITLLVD